MPMLIKLLGFTASIASGLLVALAAAGNWVYVVTSLPLVAAVVVTWWIYRQREQREPEHRLRV